MYKKLIKVFEKLNDKITLNLKIAATIFLTYCLFLFDINFFSIVEGDGFMQMNHLFRNNAWTDINYELKYVHMLRYIICLPFEYRLQLGLPYYFDGIIFSAFISIFVCKKIECLLYFLPLFVSFRTSLCICSIYGMWSTLEFGKYSFIRVICSYIFSILSSGVLLNWVALLLLYFFKSRTFNFKPIYVYLFVFATIIILSDSTIHKTYYFYNLYELNNDHSVLNNDHSVLNDNDVGFKVIKSMYGVIMRSNLVDPYLKGLYIKAIFYSTYLFFAITCIFMARKLYTSWKFYFFLVTLLNFLVEGLPIISYSFIYVNILMLYLTRLSLYKTTNQLIVNEK